MQSAGVSRSMIDIAALCRPMARIAQPTLWEGLIKLPRRQFLQFGATAAAQPPILRSAWAQTFPSRRITIVVPFPPGALTNNIARTLAEGMRASLGQSIIVENVAGADGTIGTARVAHAAPDGHTLVLGTWNTHVTNAAVYALEYDVVKDFEPVVLLPDAPMVLIVKKTMPANNLNEFIAWLKAHPDQASMGTAGAGSPPDVLGRLLREKTGTQFGLVPYRGAAPAMQDVLAGQIDAMFLNIAAALPQVASGGVKALGVTSEKRMAVAPEILTMDEAGLHGFYFRFWAALFAPRGTPRNIIDKLNVAAVKTLTDPSIRQKLEGEGFEIPPSEKQTPEALAAFQKAEIEKWWPIIKEAGIKPQ
jgi:tripartite-type tricarboxylate transporter receptor subunit TctC